MTVVTETCANVFHHFVSTTTGQAVNTSLHTLTQAYVWNKYKLHIKRINDISVASVIYDDEYGCQSLLVLVTSSHCAPVMSMKHIREQTEGKLHFLCSEYMNCIFTTWKDKKWEMCAVIVVSFSTRLFEFSHIFHLNPTPLNWLH